MTPGPFTPEHRLRRSVQFQWVLREGQKIYTRNLLVFAAAGPTGERRLGITVTRKVGNAVFRNRAKRVTREVFRRTREELPPGTDVVIIVKRDTAWPCMEQYEKDIAHAFSLYTRRARR
ncbi:MAG: ribonuclease P protein component [Pseudomonadota bacterium]